MGEQFDEEPTKILEFDTNADRAAADIGPSCLLKSTADGQFSDAPGRIFIGFLIPFSFRCNLLRSASNIVTPSKSDQRYTGYASVPYSLKIRALCSTMMFNMLRTSRSCTFRKYSR